MKSASWIAVRRQEITRMKAQCLLYSRCSIKHYLAAKAETNYSGFAQAEAAQLGTGIQEQVVEREALGQKACTHGIVLGPAQALLSSRRKGISFPRLKNTKCFSSRAVADSWGTDGPYAILEVLEQSGIP